VKATLTGLGFASPTPVQAAVLPLFMRNSDVCVQACTGSGKTIAFVVPVVEKLMAMEPPLAPTEVGAIILCPTRELAMQTTAVMAKFTGGSGGGDGRPALSTVLLIGGRETAADIALCQRDGCNIMVATPGRLLDMLTHPDTGISVKRLEVLVLDEADRLLEESASKTTAAIALLPKQRRTGIFSATLSLEVKALARAGLRNAATIKVEVSKAGAPPPPPPPPAAAGGAGARGADDDDDDDDEEEEEDGDDDEDDDDDDEEEEEEGDDEEGEEESGRDAARARSVSAAATGGGAAVQATPATLSNYVTVVSDSSSKLAQLLLFLRERAAAREKVLAFVLTCASVEYYGTTLAMEAVRAAGGLPSAADFPILSLHGKMPNKRRKANYATFVAADAGVLLCTDVAARGIDIPDVDWIVQFDPPKKPEDFIHRVGRTARAGRAGSALLYLLEPERSYLAVLQARQVPVTVAPELAVAGGTPPLDMAVVCKALRAAALDDRDVLEKGTKAFISFIRGYVVSAGALSFPPHTHTHTPTCHHTPHSSPAGIVSTPAAWCSSCRAWTSPPWPPSLDC